MSTSVRWYLCGYFHGYCGPSVAETARLCRVHFGPQSPTWRRRMPAFSPSSELDRCSLDEETRKRSVLWNKTRANVGGVRLCQHLCRVHYSWYTYRPATILSTRAEMDRSELLRREGCQTAGICQAFIYPCGVES